MSNVQQYIETHKERFLNELLELLRIPSVSADPKKAVQGGCAAMRRSGKGPPCGSRAGRGGDRPTTGHPIVYAEKIVDPRKPTVLIYGHYDVQPADPLDLWTSPPSSR